MKHKDDYSELRSEASKLVEDISRLGKSMSDVGFAKTSEAKDSIHEYITEEFATMKQRLEEVSQKIASQAKSTDKHVHSNPYLYIFGALGLGFVLGKFGAPHLHD
jgi:ElaB/YqjD/DUF883 family membrane-anchored ribosome-binding protein